MKSVFHKSFARDLKKVKDQSILEQIQKVIEEVEKAQNPQEINNLKKLSGTTDCYRIRIGDYRLGVVIQKNEVDFVRFLHRRDLYKFFP